ncbi:MAG: hypothetical protein H3C62_00420 [Gemmatimonadaceae bacterium]|nr:hypothetical protein [Gemmatimonadaceae bacterium]
MGARPLEAKDVSRAGDPQVDDVGLLGERRHAAMAGLGLVFLSGAVVALAAAMFVQAMRTTIVRIPVDVRSNGTLAIGADFVVADSLVMRPERIVDYAREFLDLRYAYDYRAGVARVLAARTFVPRDAALEMFPQADQIDRLDAQRTDITLAVDSAPVRILPKGVAEVTFYGRRSLRNVLYADASGGARVTPFKQRVTVQRVAETAAFPLGLLVRGSKGDLDQ